jgi:hypothetical protein
MLACGVQVVARVPDLCLERDNDKMPMPTCTKNETLLPWEHISYIKLRGAGGPGREERAHE